MKGLAVPIPVALQNPSQHSLLFTMVGFLSVCIPISHLFILLKVGQSVNATMNTFPFTHHFRSFLLFFNLFFLYGTQCNSGLKMPVALSVSAAMHKQRSKVNFLQCSKYKLEALRHLNLNQAFTTVLNFYLDTLALHALWSIDGYLEALQVSALASTSKL